MSQVLLHSQERNAAQPLFSVTKTNQTLWVEVRAGLLSEAQQSAGLVGVGLVPAPVAHGQEAVI